MSTALMIVSEGKGEEREKREKMMREKATRRSDDFAIDAVEPSSEACPSGGDRDICKEI